MINSLQRGSWLALGHLIIPFPTAGVYLAAEQTAAWQVGCSATTASWIIPEATVEKIGAMLPNRFYTIFFFFFWYSGNPKPIQ